MVHPNRSDSSTWPGWRAAAERAGGREWTGTVARRAGPETVGGTRTRTRAETARLRRAAASSTTGRQPASRARRAEEVRPRRGDPSTTTTVVGPETGSALDWGSPGAACSGTSASAPKAEAEARSTTKRSRTRPSRPTVERAWSSTTSDPQAPARTEEQVACLSTTWQHRQRAQSATLGATPDASASQSLPSRSRRSRSCPGRRCAREMLGYRPAGKSWRSTEGGSAAWQLAGHPRMRSP